MAIARAMVTEPTILLVDESAGALDQKTGHQIMELFHELHNEGNFIGPWFGGLLLVSFGGRTMFLTMDLSCLIGLFFYAWGSRVYKVKQLKEIWYTTEDSGSRQ